MPQRFLKPGIISSPKWDGLDWIAQSFYIRLITLVDDFGRFEANPTLLRNMAFPLREDIRTPQVQKLCQELQANQLAVFYKVDGKEYLQLLNWSERPRCERSRYPEHNNNSQLVFNSDVSNSLANVVKPLTSDSKCSPSSSSSSSSSSSYGQGFLDFWGEYPNKKAKGHAYNSWLKIKPSPELAAEILSAVRAQKTWPDWTKDGGKYIPHPATWLNARRWEDEPPAKPTRKDPCI